MLASKSDVIIETAPSINNLSVLHYRCSKTSVLAELGGTVAGVPGSE